MSGIFGIGATNIEERSKATNHELDQTPIKFEACQSLPNGGFLFLLPFLTETGLFSFQQHYEELKKGYYYINFIVLLLAFMYLCRIKNPEQLKQVSPGEFGKLLGIDRIPEAKCVRSKLKQISRQEKAIEWNKALARQWNESEENEFYYIDGHIQVYHGYKAILGKKHVSRQKLCLPGMQEFWVNNKSGMPYFYVTGNVNEKLQSAIYNEIIPRLIEDIPCKYSVEQLAADNELPRFTLVFDREAYSPALFKQLWDHYRVAVITYRKNVTDLWADGDFKPTKIIIEGIETQMLLAEKEVIINDVSLREVRRKTESGHQTSIVTTNKKLDMKDIALHMFARWSQENFFRYMRQDYAFDKMAQHAIEQIDGDFHVVNPEYNRLDYRLKKIREKISRRLAQLYNLEHENIKGKLDESGKNNARQVMLEKEMEELKGQEQTMLEQRNALSYKIKVKDMPEQSRYNRLHLESKHVQNIIKMICYRAETSFANLLSPFYSRSMDEKRMLAKSIIKTNINLIPDYENNSLTVELYSLSTPRENRATKEMCDILNKQNAIYPDTNLRLYYKMAT
ncbi:MAG: hypothetical protein Q7J86_10220 [Bacteroidota bacterium]|nr:hypothetical protein [Bacteroidota bacterium]